MVMPKAYEGNEPYIFISYAHKDSEKVLPIIQALQDRGFRVWFDAGIEAGSEWPAYIAMHLSACGCFIPFLTQNYMASDNCRQEIYFALRKKRTLLPVYLEEAELDIGLEMQLSPIQALMLQKSMGTDALLQEMCKSTKLQQCVGSVPAPQAEQMSETIPSPVKPVSPIEVTCVVCDSKYSSAEEKCPLCKVPTSKNLAAAKNAPKPMPKKPSPEELYQQGKELYDTDQYTAAFPILHTAAEQGCAGAQYLLAQCYFYGRGAALDRGQGIQWMQKAAQQKYENAEIFADNMVRLKKLYDWLG